MSFIYNTKDILERVSDGFYSLNNELKFEYINNVTEKLLQIKRENAIGQYICDVLPHSDLHKFVLHYKRALSEQVPVEFEEFFNNRWYEIRAFPSKEGLSVLFRDITEKKKEFQDINFLANYDVITEIPNRIYFYKYLKRRLQSQSIVGSFAVLFIDINNFKNVNDTYGHGVGDLVLKQISRQIEKKINQFGCIARYSGDEFLLTLENLDDNEISSVIKRIIDSFSSPFCINGFDIRISISVGVSQFPKDGQSEELLIKHSENAMYQAKKEGRNKYKFYAFEENEGRVDALKLELELHKAIENNQLLLHYQPKINLTTGKIVGVEALLRWDHPEWGMVSPETFIPIAEETGLILPIGEWVLNAACKQNKTWQQQGFSTVVSVNLSAIQFNQTNIINTIESILQKTGVEPHFLEIEITESMTVDIDRTILLLQQLKKIGVHVSIDDFGTGFSSLSYLKNFPVDTLKIDQSFVKELRNNPNGETIVKTIISMAHNLNLIVVAEGIETKEQLVFLQQHLCDEGQGYFLSKPLTAFQLQEKRFEIEKIVEKHGIPKDINEQLLMKELLESAQRELHDTIRLQQGMIFKYKNINERFIHTQCDGELLYRLGMIPSQVIGKELADFLPYRTALDKTAYYKMAWEGEEFVTYEEELNGINYLTTLRPIKKAGEVVQVIGSCIDITKRKKAEKALQESEAKYRLISENMTDIIMLLDIFGTIQYASPSLGKVMGNPLESYIGKSSFDLIHPDDKQSVIMGFKKVLNTMNPLRLEARFVNIVGKSLLFEGLGTPVLGENGDPEHFIVVGRDITEKREMEEQLSKSEKLSVVGQLAAGVAHEIRNPITSIKGFIKLLEEGIMKKEFFEVISKDFKQVEEILEEFINLAKPKEIQLKKVNIKNILKEVVTLIKPEANLKSVEIFQEYKQNLPQIMCDSNQIKQVFLNIIKNSIEAIPKNGFVEIQGSIEGKNVLIKIIDNGIGISEERVQKLGEPFYSNKEKGTGLGLMICFRIVREHNGSIKVNSKENEGTTVEIRLPIKTC
ncbi:EAL domain-containing protein [Mesobacillus maritimus]|uniref:EAL domain-containing protein n=1 Tax=Mesobacillus maritimus TaxID=1643336 RepID=UPI002042507A|nr:EAL domain-containing protein [Mesobacillus maritimus]MCM3587820.1 EAL domain-containing protein [Mesobacillus maritimus]